MNIPALLRVAVVGAGSMGVDHVARISHRINGAEVVCVVDPDADRAAAASVLAPGSVVHDTFEAALRDTELDAVVIATPGQFHEAAIVAALESGIAVFCEKPLTPDVDSALRVIDAEVKGHSPIIQVGFMRRFDTEYIRLKQLVESNEFGDLLLLHARHRNASSHLVDTEELLVRDSLVHEFDVLPWLTDDRISAIEIRKPRASRLAPGGLLDPQMVLLEFESGVLADVEIFINARFGYQVSTEAVFEEAVVEIGESDGPLIRTAGRASRMITPAFVDRFPQAYDAEIQAWVDAARKGTIAGPSSWDGYLAAVVAEAGVEAQRSGQRVQVRYVECPQFYDAQKAEL